jgi:hypothetical protein
MLRILVHPVYPDWSDQRICFQPIPEGKKVKNRVDLDLAAPDLDEETARLVSLGARIIETFATHIWLEDPQGNEFCVTAQGRPATGQG